MNKKQKGVTHRLGGNLSKGFTLIEMLVVIVIIGILATIVIVSVSGSRKKAGTVKAKATINQLVELYEQAASQGCKTVTVTSTSGGPAVFTCANPSATYGSIERPPTGFSYTITIGGTSISATYNASTGESPWNGNSITGKPINSDYTFSTSGFDGGGTFTCASMGGCACSGDCN